MRALIGHSGFVGGNLRRQSAFDAFFRGADIDSIRGREFTEIVCAGAPAEKWKANAQPEEDRQAIGRLTAALGEVRCDRFVLISTIDVYPVPRGVDETAAIDPVRCAPYGRHRLLLEQFIRERFPAHVMRLPALFGPGLKKNAVYDLLHDHQVEKIDGRGVFQFYPVERLSSDIERMTGGGIELLNVAAEPLSIAEVARRFFKRTLRDGDSPAAPRYDFRSVHARAWGRSDGYLYSADTVLRELGAWIESERTGRQP